MQTAKSGDSVTVVYDGMLKGGDIFESSEDNGPLNFKLGEGSVMAGFEQAVIGMAIGESKTIMIQPQDAYGLHQEELVHSVKRSTWDEKAEIKPGVVVGMTMEKDGKTHQIPAMITEINGDMVTIDFNHPLAGKEIIYHISLQKINEQGKTESCNCPPSGCGCSC